MFSKNIVRFVKRSASVRPPLSFKFGVHNEDPGGQQDINENYQSKRNSNFKDKNNFSKKKNKQSKILTNSDEVEKNNIIEKTGDKLNFVSSDLMQLDNNRKESATRKVLFKSHKAKWNVAYEDDIVFGIHPVFLALQSNKRKIYEIFYKKGTEKVNKKIHEIVQMAHEKEIPVTASSKKDIDSIVGGDRVHQGVCCNASALPSTIIDDTVHNWISNDARSGQNEDKNDYITKSSAKSFDYYHILDNHVQTNKFLNDVKKNQANSKDSGLLNGKEKLEKTIQKLTIEDDFIEFGTISNKSESNCRQVWIYLDSIHDPMNLGAILRSSYYMGIDKVIISKENSCRISGVVSKASAGVAEIMEVYQVQDTKKFVEDLKAAGWCTVVGTASNDPRAVPISSFTSVKNTLILIGNEGTGVNEFLSQLCDTAVTIPPRRQLHPAVDSLNVSVATALLLYTITNNINQ